MAVTDRAALSADAWRRCALQSPLTGYLYRPDGAGPFPAVVGLHGCGGLLRTDGKPGIWPVNGD